MMRDEADALCAELPVWVKSYRQAADVPVVRMQRWTVEFLDPADGWAVVEHVSTFEQGRGSCPTYFPHSLCCGLN